MVQELPDEVLVYDLERHRAFCLGGNLARIWNACTGRRTSGQIARALIRDGACVDEDIVRVGLHRLGKARLLREQVPSPPGGDARTRRELLRRAAVLGGLSLLAITAPTAGQAATCLANGTCVDNHCANGAGRVCCSGNCKQNAGTCGTGQMGFLCQ